MDGCLSNINYQPQTSSMCLQQPPLLLLLPVYPALLLRRAGGGHRLLHGVREGPQTEVVGAEAGKGRVARRERIGLRTEPADKGRFAVGQDEEGAVAVRGGR